MIRKLLQDGFLLKKKGYYKHAIEVFYKALEVDNTSLELLLEIAEAYYLLGNEERALAYIEQILDKNPVHIESLELLKNIFINKSALAQAEQSAKNIYCITNLPEDLAEIFHLLNMQGKFSEIFEYNTNENTPATLYEKAYAKFYLGDFLDAEKYIEEALKSCENTDYILLKGNILFKMNKISECIELVESKDSEIVDSRWYNFLGLLKQYDCDYDRAIAYFLKAVKLAPNNDEFLYNCASTYFKMNDINFAKKYYNRAISINPDNPTYHFALANLYYSEKKYRRALEELNYDTFEAKLLKSIILHDTGYLALAQKELKKLELIQPENPIVLEYLTKIHEELKI